MSDKKLKYAVIGDPVAHSLSPQLHNPAFKALGINAEYVSVHVKEQELPVFAERARKEFAGFNITVPHKNAIIPFLDSISDECKLTGSVNTVKNTNGHLHGESTDGYGLETAINEEFGIPVKGNCFLFVGTGGTVKAVSFHFAAKGAERLLFANRTVSKSETLVDELKRSRPGTKYSCCSLDDKKLLSEFISKTTVVIQCTSLGLKDGDPCPLEKEFFRQEKFYYDTIYRETAFIQAAKRMGCRTAGGLSMLLHQGVASFSIWTGQKAPVEVMRKSLYDEFAKRNACKSPFYKPNNPSIQ
ncbi:MAG TPA: shikimate dehydrogenase [Lentisphaeria bacterium]|nr:MAG: shikimate dehydrogenase [Lentisphaerae bacterium GWF2_49_21]HBC85762.1 shikimate dehydrogenase [Lentisphaeria bacterium]